MFMSTLDLFAARPQEEQRNREAVPGWRRWASIVGVCILPLFGIGCTHIKVPPRADIETKSIEDLKQVKVARVMGRSVRLEQYGSWRRWMLGVEWDEENAKVLTEAWGEPDRRGASWWNTCIPIRLPPLVWVTWREWDIGDKTVLARIDHPYLYGYRGGIWTIQFKQRDGVAPGVEATPAEAQPVPATPGEEKKQQ